MRKIHIALGKILAVTSCTLLLFSCGTFHTSELSGCSVTVSCPGLPGEFVLSDSDAAEVTDMLDQQTYFRDNLSCGFSEDASITFTGENEHLTLYLAQDACPFLFSPEKGKYLKLSAENNRALREILISYGGDIWLPENG